MDVRVYSSWRREGSKDTWEPLAVPEGGSGELVRDWMMASSGTAASTEKWDLGLAFLIWKCQFSRSISQKSKLNLRYSREIKKEMEGIFLSLWVISSHLENCVRFWSHYNNSVKTSRKIHDWRDDPSWIDWRCWNKEQKDRLESSLAVGWLRKGWWTPVGSRGMWAGGEKVKRQPELFLCRNYSTTNQSRECPAQNKQRRCQAKGCGIVELSKAAWSKRSDKFKKQ